VVWIAFVVWMNVTTFYALSPATAQPEWERTMKIQLISFISLMLLTSRERVHLLVWVIALSLGYYGLKGGVFAIMTGGNYRVMGPPETFFSENNTLALVLIMTMPLIWYLRLQASHPALRWALAGAIGLVFLSVLGSHSRGALLGIGVMGALLWLKSPKKLGLGLALTLLAPVAFAIMPEQWFERMATIGTYEQDRSAMSRLDIWGFAYALALDRPILGGGFKTFTAELIMQYVGTTVEKFDAHSIYFQVLGEHGFVGLGLFLTLGLLTYRTGSWVIRAAKGRPELVWAHNLASMLQVSLVGFAVGGAFLGLAYVDLVYHLVGIMIALRMIVAETPAVVAAPADHVAGNAPTPAGVGPPSPNA
jgi:probable O-glycosylation ligase (exosortase A-associated)